MTQGKGKVYIVGAGPGQVGYLTVWAYQLLAKAEVLIYDALIDSRVLELAPKNCQLFYVGKRGGKPSWQQSEINRLLVQQCQQGKLTVRLKGGDPFIFGRCTSEIQALIGADCQFQVVPGISSALAAPELAGIPLTDPVLSRSFAVLSGHKPSQLDWQTLAKLDTLVILMGTRQLPEIIRQLLRHDRNPETPIAIVRAAGTAEQEVWTSTLADIVEKTEDISLSPAVIVIGEAVKLRDYLLGTDERSISQERFSYRDSFATPVAEPLIEDIGSSSFSSSNFGKDNFLSGKLMSGENSPIPNADLPLKGKTILATRAAGSSKDFRDRLEKVGARVIDMPALEIGPPSTWEPLDRAIARLQDFHWLILASGNGVDYFFDRLASQGQDARALSVVKIAVVGKKTAARLKQQSIKPDFIPPNFVADSLIENFPEDISGKNILFPRVETGGREVLVKEFTARGATVEEVAAYQSGCPKTIDPAAWEALRNRQVDVITFASSKTVQYFCNLVQTKYLESQPEVESQPNLNVKSDIISTQHKSWQTLLDGVCLASIGPQTSTSSVNLLGRVDVEAREFTLDGLTQAIIDWARLAV